MHRGIPGRVAGDVPPRLRPDRGGRGRAGVELRRLRNRTRDHAGRRQQEGRFHPRPESQGRRAPPAPPLAGARVSSDGEGGARKLGFLQYLGYGFGDAANNLTFMMASSFLLIYYTDVAGIPAAAAGTLFLVVRVWGGITDLLAGRRVDATSTRWGKFRPYLLFGSLPLLLTLVALFTVPGGWSQEAKLVYAYATYALFQLLYSFVNIPYGSLSAAMTQVSDERSKLSSYRMVFTSLTILLLAIVISPQIEGSENLQSSLTITTLIFVVAGMAFYLFTFFTAREQVERSVETASLRDT